MQFSQDGMLQILFLLAVSDFSFAFTSLLFFFLIFFFFLIIQSVTSLFLQFLFFKTQMLSQASIRQDLMICNIDLKPASCEDLKVDVLIVFSKALLYFFMEFRFVAFSNTSHWLRCMLFWLLCIQIQNTNYFTHH